MKKEIKWTLRDGREATYTVELQTSKRINLDGDVDTVPCCDMHTYIDVVGLGFCPADLYLLDQPMEKDGIKYVATIGKTVAITNDIYTQIVSAIADVEAAPEWIEKQKKIKNNNQAEADDIQHKIDTGYCFSCQSYCHGDCGDYNTNPAIGNQIANEVDYGIND